MSGHSVDRIGAETPDMRALRPHRTARGLTLLELMIALTIAAILAGIAAPNFMGSLRKGRRSDAYDAATQVIQAQERWRANNSSYTTTLSNLSVASTSANRHYGVALSGASGTGYTLTLTAASTSSQIDDVGCTSMTVTVTLGNPAFAPATCWSR